MRPESSLANIPDHSLDPTQYPLDNPIGNSLLTEHRRFALTCGGALRYPPDIGPLSHIEDQSPQSYQALRQLTPAGGVVALFLHHPPALPEHWKFVRGGLLDQMVLDPASFSASPQSSPPGLTIRQLAADDVPQMIALATLTEPGPFQQRTIELGQFVGAFAKDRLIAMAGQRTHLPEYVEVSAVCTHPDARGRGLARLLMSRVIENILSREKTPCLHCFSDNHAAIRVYRDLGFVLRRNFHLSVLQNQP